MKKLFAILIMSILAQTAVAADKPLGKGKPADAWHYNVLLGFSAFTTGLAFEAQKGHHAVGVSFLPGLFYRYLFKPHQNTPFVGGRIGYWSDSSANETKDGIFYTELERTEFGIGGGYRWQWPRGWNVAVSAAVQYQDEEYSNPNHTIRRMEESIGVAFGVEGGFKF